MDRSFEFFLENVIDPPLSLQTRKPSKFRAYRQHLEMGFPLRASASVPSMAPTTMT